VVLGVLLLLFSPELSDLFGIPCSDTAFYPNILRAVFVGILLRYALKHSKKVITEQIELKNPVRYNKIVLL
jgi:hypothetical protein